MMDHRLVREPAADAALRRSTLLLRASEVLSATATTADVLATVPVLMRDTLDAAHARIVLAGRVPVGSAGPEALAGTAIEDRRARYYSSTMDLAAAHPAVAADLQPLGWQAVVCAPLPGAVGAPLLAWNEPRTFYVTDRAFIATLAAYLAQALERAADRDARIAVNETLEQAMASQPPHVDDYEVAARYLPARAHGRVGGDWYDVMPGRFGRLALVIGDVAGHDLAAAARMAHLRSMLHAYLVDHRESPATVLRRLDLANHVVGEPTVASAVVAVIDRAPQGGHRLRWSNAGHPPPILVRPDGEVRPLTGHDILLGAHPGARRHTYAHLLHRGSVLVLHTDGLVESRIEHIDRAVARLHRTLHQQRSSPLHDMLSRAAGGLAEERSDGGQRRREPIPAGRRELLAPGQVVVGAPQFHGLGVAGLAQPQPGVLPHGLVPAEAGAVPAEQRLVDQ